MEYRRSVRQLEEVIDGSVTVTRNTEALTQNISDLADAGVIDEPDGQRTRLLFKNEDAEARATAEYIEFADGVASVEVIVVDEDIQGYGVGSAIVNDVTDVLLQRVGTVYALPLNSQSAHLFEKAGYAPVDHRELDEWYVRR